MILLFILHSLLLHKNVLARPPSALELEISFSPREINIDSDKLTQRSEINIIWSCLATLFACSWVAVHPNIPAPSDSLFGRRLLIVGWMLIAPEFVIIWATRQWFAARYIAERHKDRGWTMTHGFFASMGGFMLYDNGVMAETLEIEKLVLLEKMGRIDWPSILEEDIQDKSKGDFFSKGFVVLQTTWFIIQCIARGVAGLDVTQLELATVAYAVLNGIVYALWWYKPLDVVRPVAVHLHHPTTLNTPSEESLSSPAFTRFRAYFRENLEDKGLFAVIHVFILMPLLIILSSVSDILFKSDVIYGSLAVPTFYAPRTPTKHNYYAISLGSCVGVLFGGIHCVGWSIGFQSIQEKYIWRMSAVAITFMPIAFNCFVDVVKLLSVAYASDVNISAVRDYKRRHYIDFYLQRSFLFIYCISRAALLILPLVALRTLSPSSLVDIQWTSFIPHV